MAKIYEILAKRNGFAIDHFRYGYEEVPNAMLLFYPLSELNKKDFDFKTAKPKKISYRSSKFSTDKKVVWYEDDIKEADFTATSTVAAGVLTFNTSLTDLVIGDQIRNKQTGDTMLVVAVTGPAITVDQNLSGVTTADDFIRYGFAKTYKIYSAHKKDQNDYVEYNNYVQFTSEELPEDKTDVLTNNLNQLFFPETDDYFKSELFAPASRRILLTMLYSLYAGRPTETVVGGNSIYTVGGLEHYIPASAKNVNIAGATDKTSKGLFRDEITKAYKSGVQGISKPGRLVMFCTTAMGAQMDDLFYDQVTDLGNDLSHYGINMTSIQMNGRKISIIEDSVLNSLYGDDEKVGFIVDLEGIILHNLMNGVISDNGKTTDKFGVSQIRVKPQTTWETKTITLNSMFSFVFKHISSGCFRKIIYV